MFSETVIDGMMQRYNQPDVLMAHMSFGNGEEQHYRLSDVPSADKLEKFVEDVKFGVYPLTAFSGKKPPHFRSRAASPERIDSVKSATPEPVDIESRRIVNMMCSVKKLREDGDDIAMTILLRMDDKMNRQLTCQVNIDDSAADLTNELVRLGFVHIDDRDKIQALLEETLHGSFAAGMAAFEYGAQPLTFSATINEHAGISGIGVASMGVGDFATTTTMGGLNQNERSWSVADTDPSIFHQNQQQASPATTDNIDIGITTPLPPHSLSLSASAPTPAPASYIESLAVGDVTSSQNSTPSPTNATNIAVSSGDSTATNSAAAVAAASIN